MKSRLAKGLFFLLIIASLAHVSSAQVLYNSSTGADGALDLSKMDCGSCFIQLPESGILNYTTVNIPVGKVLTFHKNSKNTPVFVLAQGKVTIAGVIAIKGEKTPGPGGFYGGAYNQPGFGPGAGAACTSTTITGRCPPDSQGKWKGPLSLLPIIGGSGGGGSESGYLGGGGGGAIVIASSNIIEILGSGEVNANGAPYNGIFAGISYGSGGAIRLVANSINVIGSLTATGYPDDRDTHGIIKIEAQPNSVTLLPNQYSYPPPIISTINPVIIPAVGPSLVITSIGGFPVPANSGQRFDTIDVILPKQLPDSIPIVVKASNIPVGSQVKVAFSGSLDATATTGTLSGTLASSTATVNVAKLDRNIGTVTYLFVSSTFDLPQVAQNFNPPGRDQVAQVRLESPLGGQSKYVFLRRDGTEIDSKKLSAQLLQQFGNE